MKESYRTGKKWKEAEHVITLQKLSGASLGAVGPMTCGIVCERKCVMAREDLQQQLDQRLYWLPVPAFVMPERPACKCESPTSAIQSTGSATELQATLMAIS